MKPYSDKPQPQVRPIAPPSENPSLWLYGVLLAVAFALIWIAFSMQKQPDWPGLLLNLASGLVGSIVVLIVIDNRMRAQELAALRNVPARTREKVLAFIFPGRTLGADFTRRLLASVEPLVEGKEHTTQFGFLEGKARAGFALVAEEMAGKTTLIQMVAASLARKYLLGHSDGRVPIIVSLKDWSPDQLFDDALFNAVRTFAACKRGSFDQLLLSGRAVILIDGFDEVTHGKLPLGRELARLRKKYPGVAWTITSRPNCPLPEDFGEVVRLQHPDEVGVSAGGDFSES